MFEFLIFIVIILVAVALWANFYPTERPSSRPGRPAPSEEENDGNGSGTVTPQ